MKRKDFIKALFSLPIAGSIMKLNAINSWLDAPEQGTTMPVLFLGHGSPMNGIEENEFVAGFRRIAKIIPIPKAILCISAHWETKGTLVTAMEQPRTIHDFGGFPKALYEVEYPAPGSPQLAKETRQLVKENVIGLDHSWGLDHGAWTVIKHLYPETNIPVVQMSLDYNKKPAEHYALARELSALRKRGVLIIGSGNMVHNLRRIAWDKMRVDDYAYDWARMADAQMKKYILDGNHKPLIEYQSQGKEFQMAIPSPDHYLPLLYALALQDKNDDLSIFNDKAVAGSLTMTSVKIG